MKRKKASKRYTKHASNGTSGRESVMKKMEWYSARLAELFARLSKLPRRESLGPDAATKVAGQAAEIWREIRHLSHEMNDLRERTGHWFPREKGNLEREAEEEKLQLRQRLGRLADAQVTLVDEWNANPNKAKRQVFEKEYQRLAKEYSEVHTELQHLRDREDLRQ
ncbi:hypothetical protein KAR10_01400 [bacterium]|nr:hypothetical protein [bacterium]